MSYILEALKKAERERRVLRVPTAETVRVSVSGARRRLWPWVVAGALLVNVAVWIVLFRPTHTAVTVNPADSSGPAAAAPPATVLGRAIPGQAAGRATEGSSAAKAAPVDPASPQAPASRPTPPEGPPLTGRQGDARAALPLALAPAEPAPADPKPVAEKPAVGRSRGASSADTARQRPPESGPMVDKQGDAKAASPLALAPAEPAPADPKPGSGRPPGQGTGVLQAEPLGPPPAPGDAKATEQGAPSRPLSRDLPAAFREVIPSMTLDVLVYSETEASRMVFINSRKYVEGQTVEGGLVVERITQEGVILSYQGQRFLLRPKHNPYLRPAP